MAPAHFLLRLSCDAVALIWAHVFVRGWNSGQDTLLESLQTTYAARAAALTDALRAALPEGATVTDTQGGFFCWLVLPEGVMADDVIVECVTNEAFPVSAIPGSNFSPSGSFGGCLRMAFTFYDAETLAKAGTVVGEAVAKLTAERRSDYM